MGRSRPRRYQPSAPSGIVRRRPQPRVRIDRGLAWYCLWTVPRGEAQVAEALREAGLGVYMPVETFAIARRGKVVERERPLLGRYAFVGLNAARPQWPVVHDALDGTFGWVYGVKTLARVLRSASGNPLRVPASALQWLANGLDRRPEACSGQFRNGGSARVVNGPWQGFQAEILDSTDFHVRGLLNLFGRQTMVEFTPDQLEVA